MQIIFYKTESDTSEMPKTLETIATRTGTLKENVDILHPTFEVTSNVTLDCNYCYISDFNRYYYCRMETVRTGLYRVHCDVDVLQSWYNHIVNCPVVIERAENAWNAYIPDGNRQFYQYTQPQYITLGDIGKPTQPIIVTAG